MNGRNLPAHGAHVGICMHSARCTGLTTMRVQRAVLQCCSAAVLQAAARSACSVSVPLQRMKQRGCYVATIPVHLRRHAPLPQTRAILETYNPAGKTHNSKGEWETQMKAPRSRLLDRHVLTPVRMCMAVATRLRRHAGSTAVTPVLTWPMGRAARSVPQRTNCHVGRGRPSWTHKRKWLCGQRRSRLCAAPADALAYNGVDDACIATQARTAVATAAPPHIVAVYRVAVFSHSFVALRRPYRHRGPCLPDVHQCPEAGLMLHILAPRGAASPRRKQWEAVVVTLSPIGPTRGRGQNLKMRAPWGNRTPITTATTWYSNH